MQKFKYILILILTFIFGGCFKKSDIQEIDSFKEAQTTLDKADKNTLVIFDIDRTLTVPANVFLQHWFFDTDIGKQFVHETNEHIDSQENPKEYGKLIRSKRKLAFTDQPIESITVDLVKQLQNRGIKVIALTYYKTGGMGLISSLPQWRYEKLKEIGIDFSRNLAPQNVSLPQFTSKKGRHPVFYKGILLTELFAKGDVLGTFLDTLNWKPHDTIFFDDTLEHLKSVKKEMKKRNIPFQGYLYKGAQHLPHEIDEEILEIQLQHLKDHDEFLSDKDAYKKRNPSLLEIFKTNDGKVIEIEPIKKDLNNDKKVFIDAFTELYREYPDVMKQALEYFETLEKFLEFAFEDYEKKEFEAHKPDSYFLHALYHHKPVGYLSFEIKDDSAFIRNLAILPTFKGKSIGRELTKSIFKLRPDIHKANLVVSRANIPAIEFYKKLGFTESDKSPLNIDKKTWTSMELVTN